MSAVFYDRALTAKFKRWTEGTKVTFTGPDETRRLFEVLADKGDDKPLQLPLICLRRALGYTVRTNGARFLTWDGFRTQVASTGAKNICAIPITLEYQVDVYTRYYEEAEDYMRNLIFNIVNYPKFEVEIPYMNVDLQHTANCIPGQAVEDNSGVSERLFPGQFTRLSYRFTVDEAYLWDVREKRTLSLSAGDLHIITKEADEDIIERLDFGDKDKR